MNPTDGALAYNAPDATKLPDGALRLFTYSNSSAFPGYGIFSFENGAGRTSFYLHLREASA